MSHNDSLESFSASLRKYERRISIQSIAICLLGIVALVAVSGWYFTSRSLHVSEREAEIAICSRDELAVTLDLFQVLVSSESTPLEENLASQKLGQLKPLAERYDQCVSRAFD